MNRSDAESLADKVLKEHDAELTKRELGRLHLFKVDELELLPLEQRAEIIRQAKAAHLRSWLFWAALLVLPISGGWAARYASQHHQAGWLVFWGVMIAVGPLGVYLTRRQVRRFARQALERRRASDGQASL